ncbi:unnamed protein product [Owenia fusiformis]|uniref:Uncharacterized protein n=1 Tax=Owenia fusiformis TaxID=6347 RepID=A0A8J1XIY0_OWEFU|nr:unnamed protein product [Owenia fusiformis]
MTSLDAERFAQGVSKCLMAMTPRLKDLHNLLVDPPKQHYSAMPTTIGTLDPPLGNTRLQIARLVNSLIQTNTHAINTELANLGTLNVLLELYFKYVWNNFLHTQLEQCIGTILSNTPTEYENKQEHPLLDQLFSSTNLIQKILDGWEDNEQSISRPGGRRKGYMGHLTKISNHLVQSLEKSCNAARMTEHIKELPEKYREKWEAFSASTLTEANKKNTVELVGGHPLLSSSEDDDADFRDIPFPQDTAMQQAFSDYQLQQMTSNFIDQFGFNEEEFAEQEEPADNPFNEKVNSIDFAINTTETNPNTAMFEQACNERIQQFDDHDSDEDIWKEVTFTQNASNQGVSSGTAPVASPEVDEIASNSSDSDSEEDLESPAVIRQAPSSSTTEKMDVDNSDITMDSGPVAMDTANSPWENQPTSTSTPDTSSSGSSENWASFGETKNLTGEASQKEDEEWADFASFSPAPSDLASTDPGPRSSSPIAMDTVESTTENQTDRPNAYLVSSAPADLGSSVDQAKPDSTVTSGTVAHIDTTQSVAQESKDDVVSSTTGLPPPTSPKVASSSTPTETPSQGNPSTPSSSQTNPNTPTSSQPGQPPSDQPQPSSNVTPSNSASPGATSQSTEAETKPAVPSTEPTPLDNNHPQEDDDLQDNFNFLASAGLMRFDEPKATGNGPTSSEDSETATVEAARAKALEALQQFTSASSTPPAQNGPV